MRAMGFLGAMLAGAIFPHLIFASSTSVYTQRPEDKAAVYLTAEQFGVRGDGVADDSAGLQRAIDQIQETQGRGGQGIVFVPEGRYRISRTIYIWPGIRVIGYGAHRPTIVLGEHTPGFQEGVGYMVFFAGGRAGSRPARPGAPRRVPEPFAGTVPQAKDVIDANPGTFYTAMSNVDVEIGEGNPAAVGVRMHAAQHCFLTHMEFRTGSGLAALKDVGNEAEDLHFLGGQFGIITAKPSPGWQFTLLDSTFEDQRVAAIDEHEAGLTLVHDVIRHVPAAITIDPHYAEELWVQRSVFEDISGAAIVISNEQNERTQINVTGLVCRKVKTLALFRESGKKIAGPSDNYAVSEFSHGLHVEVGQTAAKIETTFHSSPVEALPSDKPAIRSLPDSATWVNLQTLGAKGDGVTDDTDAIEAAIREHAAIYVPTGRYLVSRTIRLKPDTMLIGLHPSTTQFDLADRTPGFDGAGGPVALLAAPQGGTNIVSGIGLFTGGINSRASAVLWRAGADSLMDDVRLLGGHGTNDAEGRRTNPYNENHTADPDARKRWDGQYPSLWVLDGGGGTFADIWTPDTYAQAGLYVSNTETPGHVYELSSEHHVRTEVKLDHVANWELVALQTEEEHGEGPAALPLEIDGSKNILVANMHSYRVVGMTETSPDAIRVANSDDVRLRNLHVDSDSKVSFDDALYDMDLGATVRFRELSTLTIMGATGPNRDRKAAPQSSGVTRLAQGFFNIAGATVDKAGRLYFVDARWQKIYRWSPERGVETIRDSPIDAANLAIDGAGNLLVVSYAGKGTVYSFNPDAAMDELTVLKPQPAAARPGAALFLPVDRWALRASLNDARLLQREWQYCSADGTACIPAGQDFVDGALYYGTKMSDVLRTFGFARAEAGKPFYATDEEEHKTYAAEVNSDGTLSGLKLFAERGGESVATGPDGKVYVAAGEVYVYSPAGELLETIDVAERPIDLVFGGKEGKTLFILARTSLYAVQR